MLSNLIYIADKRFYFYNWRIFFSTKIIRAPIESKSYLFYCKADQLHLAFTLEIETSPKTIIINSINERLKIHMEHRHLKLISENPLSHLFSPTSTPSLSHELPWQILYAKQTQRMANYGAPLIPFPTADLLQMSFEKLQSQMVNRNGERCIPAVMVEGEAYQLLLTG